MLTVEDIRTYVKDNPDLNILLEGELQSDDELIALAMRMAVSDANMVPPVTAHDVSTFPVDSIVLYGALHHLANGEAERQLRNQITYSAQGLNANIDDKFPQYNQLSQYYKQLFDTRLAEYKSFINQDKAWGGSWSPYAGINEHNYRD